MVTVVYITLLILSSAVTWVNRRILRRALSTGGYRANTQAVERYRGAEILNTIFQAVVVISSWAVIYGSAPFAAVMCWVFAYEQVIGHGKANTFALWLSGIVGFLFTIATIAEVFFGS